MSQTNYLVVVRIRGTINVREDMKDTLRMLRLNKGNNATIIPPTPQYLGTDFGKKAIFTVNTAKTSSLSETALNTAVS